MTLSRLKVLLVGVVIVLFARNSTAITVQPAQLQFDARLDEAPLLTLNVDLQTAAPMDFSVEIDGFKCDRRIISKGDGKYAVLVAPDTSSSGSVDGEIVLRVFGKSVGDPVPLTGIVRPWVRVQPTRLFIGSVGHGAQFTNPQAYSVSLSSDNAPFDVESVEFEGINGASWACDPPAGTSQQQRRLIFTFSPDALADGVPYGALAKKFILVHLSHPKASDVAIPVMGIVSVNTTGRDYSLYLYNGHVRWSGYWRTPNIAAAFLATATILICGIGCSVHNRLTGHFRWQITATTAVFTAMAAGCFFLAETYSRGGWIAAGTGILILLLRIRSPRFYTIGLAVLFILAIAMHPAGLRRAASTADISEDKSINHRLMVWEGALQMIAEHPWGGVGSGQFGNVFKKDYQLPTQTEAYSTAVNDFLTLGAERGIPLLALVISLFLGLAAIALRIGIQENDTTLVGCGSTIMCYLTCCWFSSIGLQWNSLFGNPSFLVIAAAIGIFVAIGWREICLKRGKLMTRMIPRLISWLLLGITIAITCWIAGIIALEGRPMISKIEIKGVHGIEALPRWSTPKGSIVYIGDSAQDTAALLRNTLRPLAVKGWRVIAFDQPIYPSDADRQNKIIVEQLQKTGYLKQPWYIAGYSNGARQALILSSLGPSAVACYLLPPDSAFFDQSYQSIPSIASLPILLAAQNADPNESQCQLKKLLGLIRSNHPIIRTEIYKGGFPADSPRWQQWISDIDSFFRANQ